MALKGCLVAKAGLLWYNVRFVRPSRGGAQPPVPLHTGRHRTTHRNVAESPPSHQTGARQAARGRPPDGPPAVISPPLPCASRSDGRKICTSRIERAVAGGRAHAQAPCQPPNPLPPVVPVFRRCFAGNRCPAFDQQRWRSFGVGPSAMAGDATGSASRLLDHRRAAAVSRKQPPASIMTPAWRAPVRATPG
jgi:hypothetical protein